MSSLNDPSADDRIREGLEDLRQYRGPDWRAWTGPRALLVGLMRLLGLVYLVLAVRTWGQIIGVGSGVDGALAGDPLLLEMGLEQQVLTVLLAVLYPFVAVGLWTASAWGVVVWLLAAGLRLVFDMGFVPGAGANETAAIAVVVALMVYLALTLWRVRAQTRRGPI